MPIKISNEMIKKLEPYAFESTIDDLMAHCDQSFPYLRKTMGEARLRQVLTDCANKAEKSGFTQKGTVQFYLDMIVVFGIGFESDLQYPWIAQTLTEKQHLSQLERTLILHNQSKNYQDKVIGEQSQYFLDAARHLQQLSLDTVKLSKKTFNEEMLSLLKNAYPQKYAATAENHLKILIENGINKARTQYQFEEPNQTALIIVLMFLLGHQFNQDPFYPWASAEPSTKHVDGVFMMSGGDKTAKRLEKRAKTWLSAVLNNDYPQNSDEQAEEDC